MMHHNVPDRDIRGLSGRIPRPLKINYVSYFNPLVYSGGGEMIMRSIIESGQQRGHIINVSSVRPRSMQFDPSADIDILADVFNYPGTVKSRGAWLDFPKGFIHKIAQERPFVHFNNAYVDVCNLGYLPCSGSSKPVCQFKSPFRLARNLAARDFSSSCFLKNELVRQLFVRSKLNAFLSPLHHKVSYQMLGMSNEVPAFVMKPAIDGGCFFNRNSERDIDYLFVGVIGEAKGLAEMRQRFADKDIHFIGRVAPGEKLDFGTYHGPQPYEKIPEYMNRARNFVFLPRWPEPQGRVVIEAALCGCKLITNENVGATSFPFDISDVSNFHGSAGEFWEAVEGHC